MELHLRMKFEGEKMVKRGDRVRLISCSDSHTKLPKNIEGEVTFIDSFNTVHVRWDNGVLLGLIPGMDSYKII